MTTKYYSDMTEGDKETVIQMYNDAEVEPETYTEYPSPPTLRSMTGFGERRRKIYLKEKGVLLSKT